MSKYAIAFAALAALFAMVTLAQADEKPSPTPNECPTLAEAELDLTKGAGPGKFVKLTREQTIWMRGYYVGSPPASADPDTYDAYLWRFPHGSGAVFFMMKDVSCSHIFMPPGDVAALLNGGI